MGQRLGFSEGDIMKINAMYRCIPVQTYPSGYAAPVATQYPYQGQYYNYGTYPTNYGYTSNGYYYQG